MLKGKRNPRKQAGLLPGESRRRSLVTVDKVKFVGSEPDQYGRIVDHYIVSTHRLDSEWIAQIEYKGEAWTLPGAVIARLIAQRDSIIKAERSERAQTRANNMKLVAQA